MKPRLVFIDDDPQELDDLRSIVQEDYEYCPIQWPAKDPIEALIEEPPAIFVLDLYFSPNESVIPNEIPNSELAKQAAAACDLGKRFSELYNQHHNGKKLLHETFSCIQAAYDLLWAQCRELKQSAENGRNLLARLKGHPPYKRIPIVFYSRKVTVEEAVRALQAGAVAVIPKPNSPPDRQAKERVLNQLKNAQAIQSAGGKVRLARWMGLNVNITLFKQEFSAQKTELTVLKI